MFNEEFIRPYYLEKLNSKELQEIQEYIFDLKDSDFVHNQIEFTDNHTNEEFDNYRSCEIHHPRSNSVLFRVGKKFFQDINKRFYRYDLKNICEFQLIKYYEGGNYNWHCDYGISPKRGVVRKLSMSIQLTNPDEYEGGELQIVDYSNHTINAPTDLGTVIVFDSKIPHKVWPVTFGKRIALVGWVSGPRLR